MPGATRVKVCSSVDRLVKLCGFVLSEDLVKTLKIKMDTVKKKFSTYMLRIAMFKNITRKKIMFFM